MTELDTMYRVMILYMLNLVEYPLTNTQITNFVLEKEYTNYFTVQEAITSLLQTDLITAESTHNNTRYHLTDYGRQTLDFFHTKISDAIKEDIGEYLKKNELEMRSESSIQSNYYKAVNGEYEAELTALDKEVSLVTIRLTVPTEELAISICENWQKNNKEIYQYLTTALF